MTRWEFHGCSRCEEPNYRWPQRYCHNCQAAYQREWRARQPKRKSTEKELIRARSRGRKRLGLIAQLPCENCGNPESEMHHPDYGQPDTVWWLCKVCHGLLHGRIQRVALDQRVAKVDLSKPPSWVTKKSESE